jgi:hypothetical protein
MRKLEATDVLALWERGAARHALDRSALLCAWARPELAADSVVDLPLGEVTTTLLELRAASFGDRMACHVDCGHCGERLELVLWSSELLQAATADARTVELHGRRVRAPSLRDLAAVADDVDIDHAAWQLLARCTLPSGAVASPLSDDALRDVEDALEALDPNADLALEVHCAACGQRGSAQLDAGELLWDEIDARARALLGEVHVLARAYGWSEGEILILGATRRAAYLAMVAG